ncbi:hypothetical protein BD289DRAFT_337911, partial [Coniella lustricola]
LFLLGLLYLVADYDNPIRLALRFNIHRAMSFIAGPLITGGGGVIVEFPIDWASDVAIILKTGYGTQERAAAWLRALPAEMNPHNVLVIGDFERSIVIEGNRKAEPLEFRVHDVVADVLRHDHDTPMGPRKVLSSQRGDKYRTLTAAVAAGEDELARNLSAAFGWELDAMKFIPGLDLAHRTMPHKKWFILVDDDTYLIQPSLDAVLGSFDSSRPYYLGNAIGDYRQRFAHGGSSVILSHAAMNNLFSTDGTRAATTSARYSLAAARRASLTEIWGDRLLASALLRLGIHIDEDSSRFFNGEQPWATRVRKDRFCAPLATFHRLSAGEMVDVGRVFGSRTTGELVMWIDLWDIYGAPPFELFETRPLRREWDHVGPLDEHTTTIEDVPMAEACLRRCEADGACLAWTWEERRAVCHLSPWITVGREAPEKVSGLHIGRVTELAGVC